jgi:hypothetical protein
MNDYYLLKNAYGGFKESFNASVRGKNYSYADSVCGTVGDYIFVQPVTENNIKYQRLVFDFTFNPKKVNLSNLVEDGSVSQPNKFSLAQINNNLVCLLPTGIDALNVLFSKYQNEFDGKWNNTSAQYEVTPKVPAVGKANINAQKARQIEYQNFARAVRKTVFVRIVRDGTKFQVQFYYDDTDNIKIPNAFIPFCFDYAVYTKENMEKFIDSIESGVQPNGLYYFKYPNTGIVKYNLLRDNLCNINEHVKLILQSATLTKFKNITVRAVDFNKGKFEFPAGTSDFFLYKDVPGVVPK